jgi:hypothetical protein
MAVSACSSNSSSSSNPNANDSGPIAHQADVASQLSVRMDPSLSYDERALVIGDLYQLLQYQISADPSSYFAAAFGSTGTDGVVHYLNDRISTVIDQDVQLNSRLSAATNDTSSAPKAYTVALNVGAVLWFTALTVEPETLYFNSGDTQIPVTSSRVGIVQLGAGYTAQQNGQEIFPPLVRLTTFVHEARHSDCTGGLDQASLASIEQGEQPVQHSCGHLHIQCPASVTNYAGLYACDAEAWGAYSIQAIYAATLINNCTNCSNSERVLAQAIAADALMRVIPAQQMLNGDMGPPDMSSDSVLNP